jgi:hypothetical protein
MSVACPNGHQSETTDYCDQCGAKIEGAPAPGPPPAAPAPPDTALPPAPVAGDELCPLCQAPRVGDDRFCEGCGYDYTAPPSATSSVLAASEGATGPPAWTATATADREYFDRIAPDGVAFPLHCPPRTFLIAGGEIRVGRRSSSRGIQPEIDLSGAPEDSAISHLHCLLIEQADDAYAVVDPGSTNGTTVNDDPTPLAANVATPLADGDRIHLGAWTTITLQRRSATSPAP